MLSGFKVFLEKLTEPRLELVQVASAIRNRVGYLATRPDLLRREYKSDTDAGVVSVGDRRLPVRLLTLPYSSLRLGRHPDVYRVAGELGSDEYGKRIVLGFGFNTRVSPDVISLHADDVVEDLMQIVQHELSHYEKNLSWAHHRPFKGRAYQRQGFESDANFTAMVALARRMKEKNGEPPTYDELMDQFIHGDSFRDGKARKAILKRFAREGLTGLLSV